MRFAGKNNPLTTEKALERLQGICARSETCEFEALEKLRKWGITVDESKKIISELKRNRFIDNSRYARAFVRDKYLFNYSGRRKIEFLLKSKRISSEDIDDAMSEIDEIEYYDCLKRILEAKLRTFSGNMTVYEDRMKIIRMLAQRGYETRLIIKAIDELR